MTMIRNFPFFAASVTVHIVVLSLLFSKPEPNKIKEPPKEKHIVEVELVKNNEDLQVEKSIISYKQPDKQMKLVVPDDSPVDDQKSLNIQKVKEKIEKHIKLAHTKEDFNAQLKQKIITIKKISENNIIKKGDTQKARMDSFKYEPSISVKILYNRVDTADNNIKDRKIATTALSDVRSVEDKPVQSASPYIKSYSDPVSTNSSTTMSEARLEQDIEMVRDLIQEKANRLVPIVYQKKRVEKKKRTALVELLLSPSGYVEYHNILKSTGLKEMDRAIRTILHLGEPYIYIPYPINIELTFLE